MLIGKIMFLACALDLIFSIFLFKIEVVIIALLSLVFPILYQIGASKNKEKFESIIRK